MILLLRKFILIFTIFKIPAETSQMKSTVGQFNWASAAAMGGHNKLSRPSVDFNQAWMKNCSGLVNLMNFYGVLVDCTEHFVLFKIK